MAAFSKDKFKSNPLFGALARTGEVYADAMIPQEIRNFQKQNEITRQELNAKRNELAAEKRRVEVKQIRSLRGKYRPHGFLGESSQENNPKLGD